MHKVGGLNTQGTQDYGYGGDPELDNQTLHTAKKKKGTKADQKREDCEEASTAKLIRQLQVISGSADDDGDARISATELRQILRSMDESQTDEVLDTLIDKADTDDDGQINHDAFVKLMTAWNKGKEDGKQAARAGQRCASWTIRLRASPSSTL